MSDIKAPRNPRTGWSLRIAFVPLLVAAVFGWWMLARRQYLLIDDAYISFRYATNLAHGHGLVWNVGVPVEGYTCLLWVLLLSCFAFFGADLTWPAVLLSVLFGLGCLELMRRIVRIARPSDYGLGEIVPGLLLASIPSFAHAMTSGMEETFFAFLVLTGVHLLIRGRNKSSLRVWAGAAFAAASLTRPEGPLIAAVALAVEASPQLGGSTRPRDLVATAATVGLTVIVHTVLRLSYYGYFFPNTFYAKVIFGQVTLERGVRHILGFTTAGGWLLFLGLTPATRASTLRPWVLHGYSLLGVYCTYLLFIGGDHPHWFRFYLPLLPLPLLGVAEQLRLWDESTFKSVRGRALAKGLRLAVACSALAIISVPFSEADEPIVGFIDRPLKRVMHDVDRFFDEVPPQSFCAVAAIGYVGYRHLGLHILDTWGLTDTHIAHLKVLPSVKFGHDKQDLGYVASMKPDYVYIFSAPPVPPMPGYDTCWPSDDVPAALYRRARPLAATEARLGLPTGHAPRIELPPKCRLSAFAVGPLPAR